MIHRLFILIGSRTTTLVLALLCLCTVIGFGVNSLLDWRLRSISSDLKATSLSQYKRPGKIQAENDGGALYEAAAQLAFRRAYSDGAEAAEKMRRKSAPEHELVLKMVELATARPECSSAMRYDRLDEMPQANYLGYRGLVNTVAGAARLAAGAGDRETAARHLVEAATFLRRIDLGPHILGYAMRMSLTNMLLDTVDELKLDSVPAVRDQLTLLKALFQDHLARSVEGEIAWGMDIFRKLESDASSYYNTIGRDPAGLWTFRLGGSVRLRLDEIHYLDLMKSYLHQIRQGAAVAPARAEFPFVVSAVLIPNLQKLQEKDTQLRKRLETY